MFSLARERLGACHSRCFFLLTQRHNYYFVMEILGSTVCGYATAAFKYRFCVKLLLVHRGDHKALLLKI